jgi:hypothetical protein
VASTDFATALLPEDSDVIPKANVSLLMSPIPRELCLPSDYDSSHVHSDEKIYLPSDGRASSDT